MDYFDKVSESAGFLRQRIKIVPKAMVVLSGRLSDFAKGVEDPIEVLSSDVPNFPTAKAEGHEGTMVFGKVSGVPVAVFKGRFHFYEGHTISDIAFPVFVMNALGARIYIGTNAAGSVNRSFKQGDIMLITDHINFIGANPLTGISVLKPADQFPDMTEPYSARLLDIARQEASDAGIQIKEGVFLANSGPSYETRAEVRMCRGFGVDAVGMSTVPEVIAARFLRMEVLAFSCIANVGADLHPGGMNHREVLNAMNKMKDKAAKLLAGVIGRI